jgi:hypothetical protein
MNAPLMRRDLAVDASPAAARPAARAKLELASPAVQTGSAVPHAPAWRRWLSPARLGFLATAVLLVWGYRFPTEQYITPQSGAGYSLGIVGGSAMLLLLVYPLRKRLRFLRFLGTTKVWFQTHMVLGVLGPMLVLFHSNFSLGATNSNVALACMLVVSGSGLFGRYFYAHIHHGLHGRRANLAELKLYAEKLRWVITSVDFLPGLVERIDAEEEAIVARCGRAWLLTRPLLGAVHASLARRRLRRYVRGTLRTTATAGAGARRRGLAATALTYVDDRLSATRRVVEFAAFARFFSLWHALHMPLFLMLLIAGVVHVVAVHVY